MTDDQMEDEAAAGEDPLLLRLLLCCRVPIPKKSDLAAERRAISIEVDGVRTQRRQSPPCVLLLRIRVFNMGHIFIAYQIDTPHY